MTSKGRPHQRQRLVSGCDADPPVLLELVDIVTVTKPSRCDQPAGIRRRFARMYDLPVGPDRRPSGRLLVIVAAVVFASATALGVVRQAGASPVEQGAEGVLASAALVALLAAGALVLLARVDRPSLLVTAGTVLVPCSLISFAGLTLPLLGTGGDAPGDRCPPLRRPQRPPVRSCGSHDAGGPRAGEYGRAGADRPRRSPARSATPTSSGGTSDVVTVAESLLCLGLLSLAAVAAWYMASPLAPGRPAGA